MVRCKEILSTGPRTGQLCGRPIFSKDTKRAYCGLHSPQSARYKTKKDPVAFKKFLVFYFISGDFELLASAFEVFKKAKHWQPVRKKIGIQPAPPTDYKGSKARSVAKSWEQLDGFVVKLTQQNVGQTEITYNVDGGSCNFLARIVDNEKELALAVGQVLGRVVDDILNQKRLADDGQPQKVREPVGAWEKPPTESRDPSAHQTCIAEYLCKQIMQVTNEKGYTDLDFLIVLPPRKNLQNQTLARLVTQKLAFSTKSQEEGLSAAEIEGLKQQRLEDLKQTVVKSADPNKYSGTRAALKNLAELAKQNPKTMYLIIQDECHWGIRGSESVRLGADAKKGQKYVHGMQLLVDPMLLKESNIYFLQVSATASNNIAVKEIPKENICDWKLVTAGKALKSTDDVYQGLPQLFEKHKVFKYSVDALIKNIQRKSIIFHAYTMMADKAEVRSAAVVVDYACALKELAEAPSKYFSSELARKAMMSLFVSPPSLTVIRLSNQTIAEVAGKLLREIRNSIKTDTLMEIFVDTSEVEKAYRYHHWAVPGHTYLQSYDDIGGSKRMYLTTEELIHAKQQYNEKQHTTNSEIPANELWDYAMSLNKARLKPAINGIMILVEKGRMGDTFPRDLFKFYDLRSRYGGTSALNTSESSFLQDVGRAFGYGERPEVFLSMEGFTIAEGINNQSLSLAMDKLKEDATNKKDAYLTRVQEAALDYDSEEEDEKEEGEDEDEDDHSDEIYVTNEDRSLEVEDIRKRFDLLKSPNKTHMYVKAKDWVTKGEWNAAMKRRFILKAQPQIGKTGAFMLLLELLNAQILPRRKGPIEEQSSTYWWMKMNSKWYKEDSNNLHKHLHSTAGRNEFVQYHKAYEEARDRWTQQGIQLPAHLAATRIEEYTGQDAPERSIKVADFGCGVALLAQKLMADEKKRFSVVNFDHCKHPDVPNGIDVFEADVTDPKDKALLPYSMDYVVSCLALMGSNYYQQLLEALRVLNSRGELIIWESKTALNDDTLLELKTALETIGFADIKESNEGDLFVAVYARKKRATQNEATFPVLRIKQNESYSPKTTPKPVQVQDTNNPPSKDIFQAKHDKSMRLSNVDVDSFSAHRFLTDQAIHLYISQLQVAENQLVPSPSIVESLKHGIAAETLGLDLRKYVRIFFMVNNNKSIVLHNNPEGTHWSLLMYYKKRFYHYDSSAEANLPAARKLIQSLKATNSVEIVSTEPQTGVCPQQNNGYDCGAYMLAFTELKMAGEARKVLLDKINATYIKQLRAKLNTLVEKI